MQIQKTLNGEETYTSQAENFRLKARISDDQKTMHLALFDYEEGVQYEGQYTEEDIGKQIHKKLDIIDIFNAFRIFEFSDASDQQAKELQSKIKEDMIKMKKNQKVSSSFFSTSYTIYSEGKIVVTNSVKISNKENVLSSILSLKKKRQMSPMQIIHKKMDKQMDQCERKHKLLSNQLNFLTKQNASLKQMIKNQNNLNQEKICRLISQKITEQLTKDSITKQIQKKVNEFLNKNDKNKPAKEEIEQHQQDMSMGQLFD